MLARITAFELRYQIRSPLFLISFALFFLLTFTLVANSQASALIAPGNLNLNSPYVLLQILAAMSRLAIFIVTAFVAGVVIRDQETGFATILYATPVRKSDYVIGRFAGAMVVAVLVFTAVPLAVITGCAMPWVDAEKIGPFAPAQYLYAVLLYGLPVLLFLGAGLFAIATATRSMMGTYLGAVGFLVLYITSMNLLREPAYDSITALLDPFGVAAARVATKYWTVAERNSQLPPLQGALLANRLLWLGVAGVLFAAAYALFRFEARGASVHRATPAPRSEGEVSPAVATPRSPGRRNPWAAFGALARFEVRTVLRSPAFFVLLLLGVLLTYAILLGVTTQGDVHYLPVTRMVVQGLQVGFGLFPLIIAVYYSGELVWRDRDRRIHEIVDASPVPGWTILLPKVMAVTVVLCATLAVGVLTGMLVQLAHGYREPETLHYFQWFLLPESVALCQIAVLSVCVQSLVPYKAVGWAVMLLYIVISDTLASFGFEHGLYHFAYTAPVPLSDMNGMGHFWIARAWYELYWSAFAALLLLLSLLLLRRGAETRLQPRLALAWQRLRGGPVVVAAVAALTWLGSGVFIYYNTNVLNDYAHSTALSWEHRTADYEKTLLRYEAVPQPRIIAVQLAVQLYPRQARADTTGSYVIENRTSDPISQLHLRWDGRLRMLELDVGPAALEKDYPALFYRIYRLATPLAPGERRTVRFRTRLEERGFPNGMPFTRIVENGTFINDNEISPSIGMSRSGLLTDRSQRRRNGLPVELRPAKLEDGGAAAFQYLRHDSDWVNAELSVTTDADQTPIAPGYTVSDEVRNGRRTLVTQTEAPIMHFFSIQSARYAIARDVWTGRDGRKVDLAVYYHPAHTYNVARILKAMRTSLDVYSERFGPYQFRQLRILEFPAYAQFAQSFAGTVPFSEGIGFIQTFDDSAADSIDEVTWVTAHEIAHQWWAHQVIGADKQGDTMLSETFAQYSALLVMEQLHGREQIRRFLKYNLDTYLRSRGNEAVEELPLERVENQPYIHYNKGALVMYWLKEAVGEDALHGALRALLAKYAFQPAPYPSTTDFLTLLKQQAPGHDQLIEDLFARITVYDMKAHDAIAHRRADGHFEVRFTVVGRKLYADGRGKDKEVPLDESFDVGAFTVEPGKPGYGRSSVLKLERVAVKSGVQTVTLVLDRLPKVVGIDPFNERVDRDSNDNLTGVKLE
jgi:ABC-type transport system involved in multi-copper enzyme maturation permease subunit